MTRTKPRILFLGHTVPYPPTRGGFIRSYNVLQQLSKRFDLTILCYDRVGASRYTSPDERSRAIDSLTALGPTQVVPVPQAESVLRLLWDHVRSLIRGRIFTYYRHDSEEYRRRLAELLAECFSLVHVDSLDLLNVMPMLEGQTVACTHHNVESELLEDRARIAKRWPVRAYLHHQAVLQRRAEARWCPRVDLNVAVSQRDVRALREISGGKGSFVEIPNGVDITEVKPEESRDEGDIDVLGLGGLSWFPNRDAADFLGGEIVPLLRNTGCKPPTVMWVGSVKDRDRHRLEHEYGITCTGFVDDVRPYIADALCYVMPYRLGGGTRLKLLEAMAAGAAIVTTSKGALGVDVRTDRDLLIADEPEAFAHAVQRVLSDAELRRRLGRNARRIAVEKYSWSAIGDKLESAYLEIMESAAS